jgi:hypothetical protein
VFSLLTSLYMMTGNEIFFSEIQFSARELVSDGSVLGDDCCLDDNPDSQSIDVRLRCRYRLEINHSGLLIDEAVLL